MSDLVFVDTGAFIALANESDQYHKMARDCLDRLTTTKRSLVTSNFILDESYTRIRRKAGLKAAVAFGEKLQSSSLKIISIDSTVEKKAWEIFKGYTDQSFSYTDCTSFALMKERKIHEAFTFDRDFTIFGFEIVP